MAKVVDKIGVILPFEQEFFRQRGVSAHYVGHPLLDVVKVTLDRDKFCEKYSLDPDKKIVGILPGSRKKEVTALLPTFLQSARSLQEKCDEELTFLLPLASTLSMKNLQENGLNNHNELKVEVIEEDRYDLMAACDVVVAASGTVTLELALLGTPMVVAYKMDPKSYYLGRLLVKLKYFSLVNLIAGESVVPELLQDEANPKAISDLLYQLLFEEKEKQTMKNNLLDIKKTLGSEGASEQAATLALSEF
jgi:lipid-A-disaccharide synthase